MPKSLLVVESPVKMKTLSKFLGKDYVIKATYGHIKDLPKSKMGVDVEHDFQPNFTVAKGKTKVVAELKKAGKEVDQIYIGSDPDREGEAIAFHVAEEMGKGVPIKRVLFNEITKKAVLEAIKSPQTLDESKYDAQKARRILDRLVGYEISPLLWERVKYGLSAGRVQSVALKLVCEREDEIDAFVKEEYWTIEAEFTLSNGDIVKGKLEKIDGQKAQIRTKAEADKLKKVLEKGGFTVTSFEEKERYVTPFPAFKTSTLQQDASSKIRFSPKKTMLLAQRLFEGVEIGKTSTGLITYMRTDSVRISDEALTAVRKLIGSTYGAPYVPSHPTVFKNSKTAQDAHEAIRPTDVTLAPDLAAEETPHAAAAGLALRCETRGLEDVLVFTDAILLERILRNLLSNAIRYTDAGTVRLRGRVRGGRAWVCVADTGRGIPKSRQKDAFEEFVQLHNPERDREKGLGLGLSIVQRLVHLLQLPLRMRSVPEHGTVFALQLPLAGRDVVAEPTAAAPADDAPRAPPPGPGPEDVVIVIDDNLEIQVAMSALITGWGCRVFCAADVAELMPRLMHLDRTPRVMVCDYRLRDGQTGLEMVSQLQAAFNADIPAVIVTGDTAPERLREAQASGWPLLHKPVTQDQLRAAVAAAMAIAQEDAGAVDQNPTETPADAVQRGASW